MLASASPRRADLLRQIGITFETKASGIDELRQPNETPTEYVSRLALEKAKSVQCGSRLTLGADTTVVLDGQILEKPIDRSDALSMLDLLQNQTHTVLTAVAACNNSQHETMVASASVRFRAISVAEREHYCSTDEPFDKAGAYGIQGIGGIFIECICGQPSTVAGLPLVETNALLEQFGVDVWKNRTSRGADSVSKK